MGIAMVTLGWLTILVQSFLANSVLPCLVALSTNFLIVYCSLIWVILPTANPCGKETSESMALTTRCVVVLAAWIELITFEPLELRGAIVPLVQVVLNHKTFLFVHFWA